MHVAVEDTKPWYKQFWPWFLLSLPATAVVAGLYTYSLAASGRDGLVVDDYYNVGKAINRSLEKGQRAAALGLAANMAMNGRSMRILLDNPAIQAGQQLTLRLSHATFSNLDQSIALTSAAQGVWAGQSEKVLPVGKWYVDLQPQDQSWRLEGVLHSGPAASAELKPAL